LGNTASASYSITVYPALTPLPGTLRADDVGYLYNQTITSQGGTGTVTMTVSPAGPQDGLTFNPTNGSGSASLAITGAPTAAGPVTFTVTATDSATPTPNTATATYTITVNPALTLTPTTLPTGKVKTAYKQTITPGGGAGTVYLNVSNSAGTIKGLTVDNISGSYTGPLTISGTPTTTGTLTFTVTAFDAYASMSTNYSITINAATKGSAMVPQAAAAATLVASGNSSAIVPPVTTSSNEAGSAVGTKLQFVTDPVASTPIGKTPLGKLTPARRNRTVTALSDEQATDLALVDFDGTNPDDALLSNVAAGRKR
jgi:hypothetical protein